LHRIDSQVVEIKVDNEENAVTSLWGINLIYRGNGRRSIGGDIEVTFGRM
jgi:hypothetical protein